jgi:AAA family ATP:ADP antiporter
MSDTGETRGWARIVPTRAGELKPALLAFAYFFCVLACYYVLRPVRDEMGIRSGVRNLPWLFTGTFITSLVIAPIYAALVARLKRATFIPLVYGFLTLNILVFWACLTFGVAVGQTAVVFFVWITVFSVFAVSVFWSFMADLFDSDQAKRLYPVIAAGGSLGGFAGSATVTGLAKIIGPANLLIVAALLLAAALACAVKLERQPMARAPDKEPGDSTVGGRFLQVDKAIGGSWLAGIATILRSPYMGGIALWVLLLSLANTFAYYMQAEVISAANLDSASRTQIFGAIDLATNILIPLIQLLITGVLLKRVGIGPTLAIVAGVAVLGFLSLAAMPVLAVVIAVQVAYRAGSFALSNPAREALWPVVGRDQKYKAKNVVDNVVFRGGDVANAWIYNLLSATLGLGVAGIALIGAAVSAGWIALSLGLGRAQARKAAASISAEGA